MAALHNLDFHSLGLCRFWIAEGRSIAHQKSQILATKVEFRQPAFEF